MRTATLTLLAAAAVLVAAAAAQAWALAPAPCGSAQLGGSFAVVPGSAGAGNIVYRLSLQNRGATACFVSGLPSVTLLGRRGRALPTHVVAARRGIGAAARIVLPPGAKAKAEARFSPDVPGPGEPVSGRCERVAYRLRVRAAGGSLLVPIAPPTSVCEHGTLQFTLFTRA
jgi:hypothetical protein